MNIILERAFLALAIILLYSVSVFLYKFISRLRFKNKKFSLSSKLNIKPGCGLLFYFWAPNCTQCKTQEKIIEETFTKLKITKSGIEFKKINAHEEPETVRNLGIRTIPAIVIFNKKGNIVSWNPGLMTEKELTKNLSSATA